MTEKEYIEICILSQPKEIATKNIIQLLEQKDNNIKQLNKGINTLMTKRKKWKSRYYNEKNKAKELNNKINKVIDKMIGDKMEQFDDYVIYLIESYLEILEE